MHDNTQSLAYGSTGNICGGYMRLIEQFQAASAPFLGYLHSNGFCVARTDRRPASKVAYFLRTGNSWSGLQVEDMPDDRLEYMRQNPAAFEIRSVKPLPEKQWYQLSKATASGIRKAAQKIRRQQGFGQPYLLETVESDGDTTTYMRYG